MAGLTELFPGELRPLWKGLERDQGQIQEIRLRVGKPVVLMRNGKESFLGRKGKDTDSLSEAYRMTEEELDAILQHICHYSLYAYEDELKQGFITVAGGHRIGVAGQAVLEKEGTLRTIKHIRHINIRLSHEIRGAADRILPFLYEKGEMQNTLIISPPGCGKTTLLRDLVRQISDGSVYGRGQCVGVVDERSEIAGSFRGIPQNDVGMRTDVLDACPKALGMMLLLRSMSPRVIAIDELGGEEDMEAVRRVSSCGCRLVATIHGDHPDEIRRKKGMEVLLAEKIFQRFFIMGKNEGRCEVLWGFNGNWEAIF